MIYRFCSVRWAKSGSADKLWIGRRSMRANCPREFRCPRIHFERKRFWIDPDRPAVASDPQPHSAPLAAITHARASREETTARALLDGAAAEKLDRWFFKRRWIRTRNSTADKLERARWLVFLDANGLGKQITAQLRGAGHDVVEVTPGRKYKRNGRLEYTIRCGVRQDYDALIGDQDEPGNAPLRVIHLWSMRGLSSRPSLDEKLDLIFYSLVFLRRRLANWTSPALTLP